MKLLLDENLPRRMKLHFTGHSVSTVYEKDWTGKSDSELLALMKKDNFDALITFANDMKQSRNFQDAEIPVLVLHVPDNNYEILKKLSPRLKKTLVSGLKAGIHEIKADQ